MLPPDSLLTLTPEGLYCRAAQAWIDPWRPVPRALITHAHADHARPGCGEYWAIGSSEGILRERLGSAIRLLPVDYGQLHRIGEARVSFHAAGHLLGSAQIRIEAGGESWLVSGDYKRCADPSCAPFEPVQADVLISEATFGLPIYRWRSGKVVAAEILNWWRSAPDRPSLLLCYAFGKAQRVLAELARLGVEAADGALPPGGGGDGAHPPPGGAAPGGQPGRPTGDRPAGGRARPRPAGDGQGPERLRERLDGGARCPAPPR
jgi:putative mRNA 3-end processing factor